MNKKSLMIPITIALLLTACQSSGLSRPDIPAQTGTVIQTEETTEAPKTADVPAITAAPETSETAENATGLELPILDEINDNVTVATAGSFLTAVQAAAELLDWGVNTGLDPEEIREATVSWLSGMGNDAQTAFAEKLARVDEAYLLLLEDGAEDILSTAGVENAGYPWSNQRVETIEAIMDAAGLR